MVGFHPGGVILAVDQAILGAGRLVRPFPIPGAIAVKIVLRSRQELNPKTFDLQEYEVGEVDGRYPLVYRGRLPHVAGQQVTHDDLAEALVPAVERAGEAILGGEWSKPLARITGLNQRTVNRDRIFKHGLPPWVLLLLATASQHEHARALGYVLLGVAEIYDAERDAHPPRLDSEGRPLGAIPWQRMDAVMHGAQKALNDSVLTLSWARHQREQAQILRNSALAPS